MFGEKGVYLQLDDASRRNLSIYSASEHVQALYDHAGGAFIDTVLLMTADFSSFFEEGNTKDRRGQLKMIWKHWKNLFRMLLKEKLRILSMANSTRIRKSGLMAH